MGIFKAICDFYRVPNCAEKITDKAQIDKTYAQWRLRIFLSMFFGYILFYTCRKNISVALPAMGDALHYSNLQLGLLGSSLYFSYAFGKFINGVISDNTNAKRILPSALFISALMNILLVVSAHLISPDLKITIFGMSPFFPLLWILAFFWGVNGWFQSMGFPPIAKNLSYWFCNKERGFKWSLWSSSHELGTALSMVLSGFLIVHLGWKAVFYVPAIFAIIYCVIFYFNLQDKPETIGLPDIEEYKDPDYVKPVETTTDEIKNESYGTIFLNYIVKNPTVWLLAFAYIFVYVVRFGTIDWSIKYLVDAKNYTLINATDTVVFLPFIGVIGTIGAGYVSDKFFKGKRAPVNVLCLSILAVCLYLFKINTNHVLDYIYLGAIGVFTCGPQVLIGGLSAVESSSKKVASAVTGFCGMFGYIGAVLSGAGTGLIIDKYSWNGALTFWIFSALISMFICLILLKKEMKS